MHRSKRFTHLFLVLAGVLFVLTLAACSGSDGPTAPGDPVASLSDAGGAPQSTTAGDESEVEAEDEDSDVDSDDTDSEEDSDEDSDDTDSEEDSEEAED